MGKKKEDGSYEENSIETSAEVSAGAYEGMSSGTSAAFSPGFLAIEEHAKREGISVPIFAAVKAMKGWNPGKKVQEKEFKNALKTFLNAPIGGGA